MTALNINLEVEERAKRRAAILRAISVTRMVDYGVPIGDALGVHKIILEAASNHEWDEICERSAQRYISDASLAESAGSIETAMNALRAAAALLQCGQLAFNTDTLRKKELYFRSHELMERYADLSATMRPIRIAAKKGELYGWEITPISGSTKVAVLIIGGLSGWGHAYLEMGRALARRGICVVLAEGPGQGMSRLKSGIKLEDDDMPMLSHFIEYLQIKGCTKFGVWGNSFGGFFAAHLAVADKRITACCINGAPINLAIPEHRTAKEQMHAVFGTEDEQALTQRLNELALNPKHHTTHSAMLIVQGGKDPLVPLDAQLSFFELSTSPDKKTLTWQDGEHTIYNHAVERNDKVSDWFAHQLKSTVNKKNL